MDRRTYDHIHAAGLDELADIYAEVWRQNDPDVIRDFILNDRFFLLTQVLNVTVAWHPWVLERCREVEADPDEHLDLWSRGHFKSTIITFAGTTQEILRNPELCVCIISYKAGAADAFASQIKSAFETNEVLLRCFPDILWAERPDHKRHNGKTGSKGELQAAASWAMISLPMFLSVGKTSLIASETVVDPGSNAPWVWPRVWPTGFSEKSAVLMPVSNRMPWVMWEISGMVIRS